MIKKTEMQEIQKKLEVWKKKYPQKEIPTHLNKKERDNWLSEVYLAKDGKRIAISGGGQVLLWFAIINSHKNWKEHLTKLNKSNNINNYLEVLKYREREKMLKVNLLKQVDVRKLMWSG